jgi:hypothetical protein
MPSIPPFAPGISVTTVTVERMQIEVPYSASLDNIQDTRALLDAFERVVAEGAGVDREQVNAFLVSATVVVVVRVTLLPGKEVAPVQARLRTGLLASTASLTEAAIVDTPAVQALGAPRVTEVYVSTDSIQVPRGATLLEDTLIGPIGISGLVSLIAAVAAAVRGQQTNSQEKRSETMRPRVGHAAVQQKKQMVVQATESVVSTTPESV